MAQVTVEGSHITPSTFLAAGARVTVERTKYIENLIKRGYVNVIQIHEPIRESAPAIVNETDKAEPVLTSDEMQTIAGAAYGAPPSSAAKSVWAEFLSSNSVEYPDDATKADMIQLWNQSEAAYGKPVD